MNYHNNFASDFKSKVGARHRDFRSSSQPRAPIVTCNLQWNLPTDPSKGQFFLSNTGWPQRLITNHYKLASTSNRKSVSLYRDFRSTTSSCSRPRFPLVTWCQLGCCRRTSTITCCEHGLPSERLCVFLEKHGSSLGLLYFLQTTCTLFLLFVFPKVVTFRLSVCKIYCTEPGAHFFGTLFLWPDRRNFTRFVDSEPSPIESEFDDETKFWTNLFCFMQQLM